MMYGSMEVGMFGSMEVGMFGSMEVGMFFDYQICFNNLILDFSTNQNSPAWKISNSRN